LKLLFHCLLLPEQHFYSSPDGTNCFLPPQQAVFHQGQGRSPVRTQDGDERQRLQACNCKQGASGGVVLQFGFMACWSLYGPSYERG
jgi:hypothetical protein